MTKILFVCLGNICRSPMGEYILKDLVKKAGVADQYAISSAGTEDYNRGCPVYPPAKRKLQAEGIDCSGHRARMIRRSDYEEFDFILGMDGANVRDMASCWGGDPDDKIHLLMDYTDHPGKIADPWYTGDFDTAYRQIREGCEGFLRSQGITV